MTEVAQSLGVDASGLRERLAQQPDAPQKASSVETAHETVRALNEQEAKGGKDEKERKTYGRTPDGTGEYIQCSPEHGNTPGRCNTSVPCMCNAIGSARRYGVHHLKKDFRFAFILSRLTLT